MHLYSKCHSKYNYTKLSNKGKKVQEWNLAHNCLLDTSIAISNLSKELFTANLVPRCSLDLELPSHALREMVDWELKRFTALGLWTYFYV